MELKRDPLLYPWPKIVKLDKGKWVNLHTRYRICLTSQTFSHRLTQGALDWLTDYQLTIDWADDWDGKDVLVKVIDDPSLSSQAYRIISDDNKLNLYASSDQGVFYGLTTLRELLWQYGKTLPYLEIEDQPVFSRRGFMLDISRCKVPTMEMLKRLVQLLAFLRYNELQLYTEHTFAYRHHSIVWGDASPLTAQEIRELNDYCQRHFIDLVPNQNSFGHLERWFKHKEYRDLAECPDGFVFPWGSRHPHGFSLYPSEESLTFLAQLYEELLPNFSSPFFNVGCDETWDLGQGRSKEVCEHHGREIVYANFLCQIHKLVKAYKREMMFWGDIILHKPELIPTLPNDLIGLVWGYEANHPFYEQCRCFKESGLRFYVCPGTSSWNSIAGRLSNARQNLKNAAQAGAYWGAMGYLVTDWGDNGHHQMWPISIPGLVCGAGWSWNIERGDDQLTDVMNLFLFEDPSGYTGQIIVELGVLMDQFEQKYCNKEIFHHLLLDAQSQDHIQGIKQEECLRVLEKLNSLETMCTRAHPHSWDHRWILQELQASIHFGKLALDIGLLLINRSTDVRKLRQNLAFWIGEYQTIWLYRNRVGGLSESTDYLRRRLNWLTSFLN